jgi:hypothetical protein
VTIAGPWLERYVTEQVLDYIDSDRLQVAIKRRKKTGMSRKASEIEARLELLDTQYVDGKVSKARFDRMNAAILAGLAEAQKTERQRGVDPPVELARNLRHKWAGMPVSTQDHRCRGGVADGLRGHQPRSHRPQRSWDHLAFVTRRRVVRESSSAHLF